MYLSAAPSFTVGVPRLYSEAIHSRDRPLSAGTSATQSSGTPSAFAASARLLISAVATPAPLSARKLRRVNEIGRGPVGPQQPSSEQQAVIALTSGGRGRGIRGGTPGRRAARSGWRTPCRPRRWTGR